MKIRHGTYYYRESKMKKIYLLAGLSAVICGLLIFTYFQDLEARQAEALREPEMINVVVATCDIPAFAKITEEMLEIQSIPKEYTHEQALTEAGSVLGLQATEKITSGQTILSTMVARPEDTEASLSYKIAGGMRGMTINVQVDTGVGGYITDGDQIDVIGYYLSKQKSETILKKVKVLKVGDITYVENSGAVYETLTLELKPEQCEKMMETVFGSDINYTAVLCPRRADVKDE